MSARELPAWRRWFLVFLAVLFALSATVHGSPPKSKQKPVPKLPIPYLRGHEPPGENFFQNKQFNEAAYGLYMNRTFKTSNVIAPRINFQLSFTGCDDGSLLFVTPRGEVVDPAPVILDANGSLIWTPGEKYGQVYNFQVQHYRGEPYITFWGGNNSVGGHGEGYHYMFDKHYQLYRAIGGVNGLSADLHSFIITPAGTVLQTSYEKVNMTGRMPWKYIRESWIWDSLFQEFDLETGELIFQWRASDHFALETSWSNKPLSPIFDKPWDWFHINMVEKDEMGNYLVSARHLRSIIYVDGKTGEVLWSLGGKKNDFTDLSSPDGTSFYGQHDAHWDEDHKYITMFDNRADWEFEKEHVSKGTRLEVDLERMTVKLNMSFVHPERIFAFSQGSYQTLPNRNVLIGYGYTGAMTEFSPDGRVLCDAYLGPSSRFSSGDVQSYRNLKFNWTGIPLTKPSVLREGNSLFVSWLGATEVRSWLIQDSFHEKQAFTALLKSPKTGFESELILPEDLPIRQFIRIAALDASGRILATSAVIDIGTRATFFRPGTSAANISSSSSSTADDDDEILFDMSDVLVDHESALQLAEELEDLELMLGLLLVLAVAVVLVLWISLAPRIFDGWHYGSTKYDRTGRPVPSMTLRNLVDRLPWRILYLASDPGLRRVRLNSEDCEQRDRERLHSDHDRG